MQYKNQVIDQDRSFVINLKIVGTIGAKRTKDELKSMIKNSHKLNKE